MTVIPLKARQRAMQNFTTMADELDAVVVDGVADEPYYHQGQILLLDSKRNPSVRDHVAIRFKDGRNLLAIYVMEEGGRLVIQRFRLRNIIQEARSRDVASIRVIAATFHPGFC